MKNLLIVFGSMSSEHEISCISAANIIENVDTLKYVVTKVGIDKSGTWFEYLGKVSMIKENKWLKDEENKVKINDIIKYLQKFDVIFPVLHGKYGEDGTIQGIFEMARKKYVGCKVLGSSIAMDKICSKHLAEYINVPVVEYVSVNKNDINKNLNKIKEQVEAKIGYPMIIKPNREGSSYGVVKVDTSDKFVDAINYSLKYDDTILIEKYIDDRKEIECAIIEMDGKIIASTPGQIVSGNIIYDFDSKYNDDTSYTQIPAKIDEKITNKIKNYAVEIFKILNLNGLARIDFFVSKNKVYFNEVNTMPGFTSISMYPKMLMYDGMKYDEIISTLIENC